MRARLTSWRKARLWLLCAFMLGGGVTARSQQPAFAVATVKPAPGADPNTGSWSIPGSGSFTATHVTLARLLQLAYDMDDSQIANRPGWLGTDLFDVTAKPEEGVRLTREELRPRLQELLRERFHLVSHVEPRPSRGYALTIAKGGPHMPETKGEKFPGYRIHVGQGEMRGLNWTMPVFAKYLTSVAGFPVIDQTGLTGSYDIGFSYAPENKPESDLPPLADALRQATGLVLKPQTIQVQTLVIDSVEKVPTGN